MIKCKDNCLNFVTVIGESGKEYSACVVLSYCPSQHECTGCACFVDLDGEPCYREENKE